MHEQLLGYLLGALEDWERDEVENRLKEDPRLHSDMELLESSLAPLAAAAEDFDPPEGLARRTCLKVAAWAGSGPRA